MKRNKSRLPFPSQFSLALLIEEELGIIVSPSIPFHDFLPNKKGKKDTNETFAKVLKTEQYITLNP